jgi:hypothetical protein
VVEDDRGNVKGSRDKIIMFLVSVGRKHRKLPVTSGTPAWRLSQAPGEGGPGSAEEPLKGSRAEKNTLADTEQPVGVGGRIKRFFLGDKLDKERIKALGEYQSCSIAAELFKTGILRTNLTLNVSQQTRETCTCM